MYSNYQGLTRNEVEQRLSKFGPNKLPENPPPTALEIFIRQFKNPLVYVLFLAGLVSVFLRHYSDSIVISLAVFINAILGFIQERKASNTLESLKKMVTLSAEVIRDGERLKINVDDLVPGDIVLLSEGMKIPADMKVLFANRFFVDEAILTGESIAVERKKDDQVYMGTIVTSGKATCEVATTGVGTKLGQIAESIQKEDEDTPLKKQMTLFSKNILKVVLLLTLLVLILGLLFQENILDIFQTSVALAVSAIPEGLIISLTVVLAIGMQRILKRNGLVKNLSSAETLGSVTTICVDKTGTLTEGKMKVVDFDGEKMDLARQSIVANDLDDPIVISAFEWGRTLISDFISKHQRIDSLPFSSKDRYFASLNVWDDRNNMLFINGAPETLLNKCNLDENKKEKIKEKLELWASQGRKVVGFARKETAKNVKTISKSNLVGFTWIGMLSFSDPVRVGVRQALEKTIMAGIKIKVITGDYPATAKYVLQEIGIGVNDEQILLGSDLEKLTDRELSLKVGSVILFARTTPDQKLKIVKALKDNNEIIAMMGDGVNDAPALKKADIGIVVSQASDVAKESSDLILLDSNFATITASVEEGRGIFENIRKVILYLLSDAFGEIIVVLGAIILRLPLPVTAIQILWINLVSDGFPGLALTVDHKREQIMDEPPRPVNEMLVTNWMKYIITVVSLSSGILALAFFVYVFKSTGNVETARSAAFLALGLNSLTYVFSVKNLTNPFWRGNMFNNKWLNASVLAGLLLQVLPFLTAQTRSFFSIGQLDAVYWIIALAISLFMFIIIEIFKSFKKLP